MPDKTNRAQQVKDLATAVSTQAQVSNRTWLGLITVAVIALLPRIPEAKTPSELSLPFGLGNVDTRFYYLALFGILVVLTVAFVAAHAQQVRAGILAQNFIEAIPVGEFDFGGMQPRELYDMLRLPSLNRVAPLAQLAKGRHQFHQTGYGCPIWRRLLAEAYYFVLKVTSWFVYFFVPGIATFYAYHKALPAWLPWQLCHAGLINWISFCSGVVAMLALLHVFLNDVWESRKIVRELWR